MVVLGVTGVVGAVPSAFEFFFLVKTSKIEPSATKAKNMWDDAHEKVPPEALDYFVCLTKEEHDSVASCAPRASQATQFSRAFSFFYPFPFFW